MSDVHDFLKSRQRAAQSPTNNSREKPPCWADDDEYDLEDATCRLCTWKMSCRTQIQLQSRSLGRKMTIGNQTSATSKKSVANIDDVFYDRMPADGEQFWTRLGKNAAMGGLRALGWEVYELARRYRWE